MLEEDDLLVGLLLRRDVQLGDEQGRLDVHVKVASAAQELVLVVLAPALRGSHRPGLPPRVLLAARLAASRGPSSRPIRNFLLSNIVLNNSN